MCCRSKHDVYRGPDYKPDEPECPPVQFADDRADSGGEPYADADDSDGGTIKQSVGCANVFTIAWAKYLALCSSFRVAYIRTDCDPLNESQCVAIVVNGGTDRGNVADSRADRLPNLEPKRALSSQMWIAVSS